MSDANLHDLVPRLSGAQEALMNSGGLVQAAGAEEPSFACARRSSTTPSRANRVKISNLAREGEAESAGAASSRGATRPVTGWKSLKMGLRKPSVMPTDGSMTGSDAVRSAAMIVARQSRATKSKRRNSDDLQSLL